MNVVTISCKLFTYCLTLITCYFFWYRH